MYKLLLRPLLFLLKAEQAHHTALRLLKFGLKIPGKKWVFKKLYVYENEQLHKEVFGLKFKNSIGLAAGFDKDAKYYHEMESLGFGFVEIGTVTPRPQVGNPKPRLFRLKKDEAIINRMGFNNMGLATAIKQLKNRKDNLVIGGNIGKNKDTPNEKAFEDYQTCFEGLFPYVDYFVVNVSSPNTPGLRDLQEKEPLTKLLQGLMDLNTEMGNKPILLKIAPDLTDGQLDDIVDIVSATKIAGIISTNTTIARDGLHASEEQLNQIGNGGLSGQPLKERATAVIKYLHEKSNGSFPIIGVGGINSPESAKEKLAAGATLIQIYSGFIYEGPGLISKIAKSLVKK